MSDVFGDFDADDAVTVGDEQVDWSRVAEVAEQIGMINAEHVATERRKQAAAWVHLLGGEVL